MGHLSLDGWAEFAVEVQSNFNDSQKERGMLNKKLKRKMIDQKAQVKAREKKPAKVKKKTVRPGPRNNNMKETWKTTFEIQDCVPRGSSR